MLAGSFVTYQTESKAAWLGVPRALLERHGPVNSETAAAMAAGAAARTPHAEVSAAITGHLGPDAPPGQNGRLLLAVRTADALVHQEEIRLPDAPADRLRRQEAAATALLQAVAERLEQLSKSQRETGSA